MPVQFDELGRRPAATIVATARRAQQRWASTTALAVDPDHAAVEALRRATAALTERLVPHEEAEEAQLLPALAGRFGSSEAVAPMSRAHAEIGRLAQRLQSHVDAIDDLGELDAERRQDVLACLDGLHVLLELHFVQEEERYFALVAE